MNQLASLITEKGRSSVKSAGKNFELLCPSCSHPYQTGSKFCDEYGYNLILPQKPPEKELSFDEKLAKIQRSLRAGWRNMRKTCLRCNGEQAQVFSTTWSIWKGKVIH